MATFDELYKFLKKHYHHARFEGRNGPADGEDYSKAVTTSSLESISLYGHAWISNHESCTGKPIHFDKNLNIIS